MLLNKTKTHSNASHSGSQSEVLFELGTVVLPASDGILQGLGYKVTELKEAALGLVLEHRGAKVHVKFPKLNIALWVPQNELCDVKKKAQSGDVDFAQLLPPHSDRGALQNIHKPVLIWMLADLIGVYKPDAILSLEKNKVLELIPDAFKNTHGLQATELEQEVWGLSLAMPQWTFGMEERMQKVLGSKLLWSRLLPAGMHKIELLILFKAADL